MRKAEISADLRVFNKPLISIRPGKSHAKLIRRSTTPFEPDRYLHDHYNTPITLSQLGIDRAILPKVAKQARYDKAALYNKHEASKEIALRILEEAY